MHNGIERHEKDENLIEITKTTLEIKIKHLRKIRELTDEGKLKDIVDDVHETEKDVSYVYKRARVGKTLLRSSKLLPYL